LEKWILSFKNEDRDDYGIFCFCVCTKDDTIPKQAKYWHMDHTKRKPEKLRKLWTYHNACQDLTTDVAWNETTQIVVNRDRMV